MPIRLRPLLPSLVSHGVFQRELLESSYASGIELFQRVQGCCRSRQLATSLANLFLRGLVIPLARRMEKFHDDR
jgi:hypothetical protein